MTVIRKRHWPEDWDPQPLGKRQAARVGAEPGDLGQRVGDLVYVMDVARLEVVPLGEWPED